MADEISSPLSPPPEDVIRVGLWDPSSPVGEASSSNSHPDQTLGKAAAPPRGDKHAGDDGTGEYGGDGADDSAEDGYQPTTQKRKALKNRNSSPVKRLRRLPTAVRKPAKERKWEAPFVYTDPKSPLALADLRAILLLPRAWDVLTQEEKRDVLAKFPDETHILDAGTDNARPNIQSMRNDDNFRHDCARYCENIELGRHDEEWLSQAWNAHEKHRRGDFDAFLRSQFEEEWGVELPDNDHPASAELDYGSGAGPNKSPKQYVPESAEEPQLAPSAEGQEARGPSCTSQPCSLPKKSNAEDSSPQDLQKSDEASGQSQMVGLGLIGQDAAEGFKRLQEAAQD
ncbi:hypothetical protein MFIFM68171_04561 [Madurella fahalii]|uniref:DEUBAD domain-containing protein n=1 Tax=Madurella fahalii TaxID=1157608 RepID=A0ABQ0G9E5_9PEZI